MSELSGSKTLGAFGRKRRSATQIAKEVARSGCRMATEAERLALLLEEEFPDKVSTHQARIFAKSVASFAHFYADWIQNEMLTQDQEQRS